MVNKLSRVNRSRQNKNCYQQHAGRRNRFLQNNTGSIDWISSLLHAKPLPESERKPIKNTKKYSLTKLVKRPRLSILNHLNIILLDTSASTLSGAALQQSKAVIAAINNMSYLKRDRLALISFGNNQVTMQIPPSKPRKSLSYILNSIPAGGGTPFQDGLLMVQNLIEGRKLQQQTETSEVFILTDGRSRTDVSNIDLGTNITIIDTECGSVRLNKCYDIALQWQANYVHIDSIPHGS